MSVASPSIADLAHRRRIWGWWAFDWASQPFFTLGLTFIFGPYFVSVASDQFLASGLGEQAADARAQSLWSLGLTISGLFIACLAPVLGAMADNAGRRMPWIIAFSLFYIGGSVGLWFFCPMAAF
jgi:UMF1 family MFS transporter